MADDRLDALTELAARHNEVILELAARVRALVLTNAALMAALGDTVDRTAIREAALGGLGGGPEDAQAVSLVEALLQGPASAIVEHHAAIGVPVAPVGRLN